MLQVLADRFVVDGHAWTDLATGDRVRVRIAAAGSLPAQYACSDRCGALAALRHPLINPLLDYGSFDAVRLFECYGTQPALTAGRRSAAHLRLHARGFLDAHGIALEPALIPIVVRNVIDGPPLSGRPMGIVLQRRVALDTIADVLDANTPAGTAHVGLFGRHGSGLTTLHTLIAREARIRGYVPVSPAVLRRWPELLDLLVASHVCLIVREPASDQDRRATAACLARLALASARRHVVIRLWREPAPSAISIDPLGVTAMTGMVFVDDEAGPSPEALFAAARESGGWPGTFLNALGATPFAPHAPTYALVHEAAASYATRRSASLRAGATPSGISGLPHDADRSGETAARALVRSRDLAARGRHGAAIRVLTRAARLMEGRRNATAAAECLCELGWIVRSRGRCEAALECFTRAAVLGHDGPIALGAVISRGVVQTDEACLVEAEATLRGALVAAKSVGDTLRLHDAALALSRAVMWQGRTDQAALLLSPVLSENVPDAIAAQGWALAARIRVLDADSRGALEAARLSVAAASRAGVPRCIASAHRAMAVVLLDLGDVERAHEHARRGLAAARQAHLPLLALRLRVLLAGPAKAGRHDSVSGPAKAGHRGRAADDGRTTALPRLLDAQLKAAAGADLGEFIRDTGARALAMQRWRGRPFVQLETLLELTHSAPDERAALERLCAELCERLRACSAIIVAADPERRVLAVAGKASQGDLTACARVLSGTCGVRSDPGVEPQYAAEPIRYGGRVIAALACRWIAGTATAASRIDEWLRPAALAAAPGVRTVLDAIPAPPPPSGWNDLLGDSAAAVALRDSVARAARAPFPVLVLGESGSGKELVARAIHRMGPRRDRRWCAVNCAAISDELLEAELFGHTRGAYTGAVGERAGLFEEADGGTLFLDEVGDLSPRAQAKLLRVLQDGEVRRVGENLPRRVDVRVVAATNRRLEDDTASGRFRADLRFRLDVVRIVVPPLRERIADIPLLAAHFWRTASTQVGSCATLSNETLAALARYDWPGNVRELQNVIAWMAVHSPKRGRVGPGSLPAHLAQATAPSSGTFELAREEFERRFVRAALARAGGRRSVAAGDLGVSRQGLAKMLRRLNIDPS